MALTENREVNEVTEEKIAILPVMPGVHILRGMFLGMPKSPSSAIAGMNVRPLVAGDAFAGIAYEEADNTGSESVNPLPDTVHPLVRVLVAGVYDLPLAGASPFSHLRPLFASDDSTLCTWRQGVSYVGVQTGVLDTNRVAVRLDVGNPHRWTQFVAGGWGVGEGTATKESAAVVTIAAEDLGKRITITGTVDSQVNLPSAVEAGEGVWVEFVKDGESGVLTLTAAEGEAVDGLEYNDEMRSDGDHLGLCSDGTAWQILVRGIS